MTDFQFFTKLALYFKHFLLYLAKSYGFRILRGWVNARFNFKDNTFSLQGCEIFLKSHKAAYPIKQMLFSRELWLAFVDLTQSGSTQINLNFHLSAWIWLLYYPHSTITPFVSSLSTFKTWYGNNEHFSYFLIEFLKYLDIKILSYSHFQLPSLRLKHRHGACFYGNVAVYQSSEKNIKSLNFLI